MCPADETEIKKKLNELAKTNSETEFEALFEKISTIFDLIHDERFQKKYSDFLESLEPDEECQKQLDVGFNFSDLLKEDSYFKIYVNII